MGTCGLPAAVSDGLGAVPRGYHPVMFDQLIHEGAYLEWQVLTTDVDRIQMGLPERMLRENGAERVFEHRVFEDYARQWGEPDTGADGVRDRDRHRPEAKYNPYRDFDVAVRACKRPSVAIANHDAVVLGQIVGRLRNTTTLQVLR